MAYKFAEDEPLRLAIARSAREQLDRAIGELSEGINDNPVTAVHDARKAIKKERSLLRLARGAISSAERRRVNAALRDAARALSGARDTAVMLATVDQLSDRFVGQLPATTFDAIREALEAAREDQRGSVLNAHAVEELGAVRLQVGDWKISKDGWKAVDAGLTRSYKRGRRAFTHARKDGSTGDLHNWRKRVKDLWYHQRLLAPTCGPAVRGQAKDAHHVADLLGDDHDLAVLSAVLQSDSMTVPADVDAVLNLIDHRRTELQTAAIRIGQRLYAESPKAFSRRMRRSWTAGRATARMAVEQHPAELAAATRQPTSTPPEARLSHRATAQPPEHDPTEHG